MNRTIQSSDVFLVILRRREAMMDEREHLTHILLQDVQYSIGTRIKGVACLQTHKLKRQCHKGITIW